MDNLPNKLNYIYASGYIDGDGCFYIGRYLSTERSSYRCNASIVISSVNREPLDSFRKVFGGSVRLMKGEHENKKAIYQYRTSGENSVILAKNMLPYLVEKREEAELLIKFVTSKSLLKRSSYINEMKILKDINNLISKHHKKEFESLKSTIIPTRNDFAYLAGFIDAECCFGIQKYKPKNKPNYVYKILLQCNNTKAPAFKWLIQRFGGHIHFIDRRNHGKARKNQLTWRLSGKALSKILKDILPFLKHKKPVCEELMKFYETTLTNGGARHTETFREAYAAVIQEREKIVSKVHKLNLKGIKTT